MLWFLRKVFGIIALVWVVGWLLSMVSCLADRQLGSAMFLAMYFGNFVGIPTSIIWTVLKVISVLSARRMERPAAVVVYPSNQGPPSSVLRLEMPEPLREAPRPDTPSSTATAERDVYTYSAPGMAMCPECGGNPVIFYCSRHDCGLCLDCVAKHDNPRECAYLPAFRAPKPTAGPDRNYQGQEIRRGKPKPGEVFGIS